MTSIKNQNLKPLKNEINFFKSSFTSGLWIYKPKYHIFIDPKLATGEWDITFIDEVYKKNPNVTFLLMQSGIILRNFNLI